jgi:hypothetical protein
LQTANQKITLPILPLGKENPEKSFFFPLGQEDSIFPDCLISQLITSRLGLSWTRVLAHRYSLPSANCVSASFAGEMTSRCSAPANGGGPVSGDLRSRTQDQQSAYMG